MWNTLFEETVRSNLPFLGDGEPLTPDTDLRDHGLDSLGMVHLLSALENAFDVRFHEDALRLEVFETAGTLWAALDASLPSPAA